MSSSRPPKPPKPSRRQLEPVLRRVFLFRDWSESDLHDLARMTIVRRFERNRVIFNHGAACNHLYVVQQGRVQLSRIAPDGNQVVLNVVGAGDLLACAALFLDHAYPASAHVISSGAQLLMIDGRAFLDTLRRRSDLSFRMIGALAVRIATLASRIESRSSEPAAERVAAWLREHAGPASKGLPRRLVLPPTKKAVAEELGMTPETFSRSLAKLRQAGAIRTSRREIIMLAPDLLP